jgi:hypothetical protein
VAGGNRRSVRGKKVFCRGGTSAIPALRPGAAARGARPGAAGAWRRVLRALPRAVKGARVKGRLPGGPRREPGTRWHGTFRAGARGADRHVPRAETASRIAAVPGVDRVGVRIQVRLVRVALTAGVGGLRGRATHPPAGCAVPTIHPVPPGHLPCSCAPRPAASHEESRVPGVLSRRTVLTPAIECRRAGRRGRAGTSNCPGSKTFYFGGQRPGARLLRALRSGLP